MSLRDSLKGHTAPSIFVDLSDCVVDFESDVPYSKSAPLVQAVASVTGLDPRCSCKMENVASLDNPFPCSDAVRLSCSHIEMLNDIETNRMSAHNSSVEGPSGNNTCHNLNGNIWLSGKVQRIPFQEARPIMGVLPDNG